MTRYDKTLKRRVDILVPEGLDEFVHSIIVSLRPTTGLDVRFIRRDIDLARPNRCFASLICTPVEENIAWLGSSSVDVFFTEPVGSSNQDAVHISVDGVSPSGAD